jgi:hypothetical protein
MVNFGRSIAFHGYRFLTREDLVEGAEIMMVEMESYFSYPQHAYRDPRACGTLIKLDRDPIRESNGEDFVFYHCTYPRWEGDCFVPLKQFLATGYSEDHHGNDHRYIILKR